MRVSVDLSKYFNDHRSLAYIFINKKTMTCIQDVEERISKMFNIDNFYLTQQDHYLPSVEDVSLLIDNDDICVIPMNQTSCTVSDNSSAKPKNSKKKKKVKVQIEETMDVEQEDLENGEASKKNRKRKVIEANEDDNADNDDNLTTQKKKSKIDKPQTINTNRRETFKEHLEKILVKEDEIVKRSPNIVKTIIVSGNNLAKTDICKVAVSNDSSSDLSSSTDTRVKPNVGDKIEQPKRHRKRTRRRKRKQNIVNNEETIQQIRHDSESITPKLPIQKPSGLHIRFSNDGQDEETKPEIKLETIKQEIRETNNLIEDTLETATNYDKISDSYILKQPLIANTLPKINDVIGFKILRLNESYTPELSQFIVGKVTAFNVDEDKEVTFDIKQGLDYCLQPEGKFSIATEPAVVQEPTKFLFKWSELIEPRLIYP